MSRRRLPSRRVFFEIGTYASLVLVLGLALWVTSGNLNPNIDGLILILSAYTLLLVLPIRKFRLTWHSFEAELDELYDEAKRSPPTLRGERIADQTLARTYERSTDPRLVLLQMSVEIESKLAQIAERHGLEKQSFYQIIDLLRQKEILTDSFVINGLRFFREQRNALVHQGRVPELAKAIDIGRTLLAKLEETP